MTAPLNANVTGRDDLRPAHFRIATPDGSATVYGCVYRELGLYPHAKRFVLVDLPTGGKLAAFGDLEEAYRAMGEASRGFGTA